MSRKVFFLFLFIIISIFAYPEDKTYVFNANNIRNPRAKDGTWVTSYNGYLTHEEITSINQEITRIEKETSVEIAVVVIPNTGGDIFNAAQQIFDKWGIGKKGKDNGLLLLASIDERLFRTHVGYGLEPLFTDSRCISLHNQIIIPAFREGQYGKGILDYVKKIHMILNNPDYFALIEKEIEIQSQKDIEENLKIKFKNNLTDFIIINSLAAILYIAGIIFLIITFIKFISGFKQKYDRYSLVFKLTEKGLIQYRYIFFTVPFFIFGGIISIAGFYNTKLLNKNLNFISLLIPCGLITIVFLLYITAFLRKKILIYRWRTVPRICPECQEKMRKLNEKEDDSFLKKGEIIEEKLKTQNYDVWICTNCKKTTIESFRAWKYFLYINCPKCNKIAVKQTGSKVLSHPTYDSTGTRRLDFTCLSCGHGYSTTVLISQLVKSSSSSSNYNTTSGGSSSSSTSGSSSSSSSSSFGGGSSGGGGATSGW